MLRFATLFALAALLAPACVAQNTGGVFSPITPNDHRAVQYRATFNRDTDALAQRLHVEATPDDRTMWRVLAQGRKTARSDLDFDFVQGELFRQLTPDGERWQRGLRFDARVRDRGRPATVAAHFMNEYAFSDRWSGRLVGLTFLDIGSGARDGVQLETRANLFYRSPTVGVVGVESYNRYGSTSKINDWDDQGHQIGPFWMRRFDSGMMVFAGALFGLTDASADAEYRLWLDWAL